jgi:hypothetical protein
MSGEPSRLVHKTDISGAFESKKLGRTVLYESGHEHRFIIALELAESVEDFAEQPCAIPYERGGKDKLYHPDFLVKLMDGRTVLVEVKPLHLLVDADNLVKYEAARRYAHQRGWGWLVCTLSNIGLPDIEACEVDSNIEQAFVAALRQGPVDLAGLKVLRASTSFKTKDLNALVLRHRWHLQHGPFRIQLHPPREGRIERMANARRA